jgi:hypothetical protein
MKTHDRLYVGPACEDRAESTLTSDKWETVGKSGPHWVLNGQFLYRPVPKDRAVN